MNTNRVFDEIANMAGDSASYANEGDYYGLDGLLHCGKCDEPKEMEIDVLDEKHVVHIPCSCEAKERADAEAEQDLYDQNEKAKRLRTSGFPDAQLRRWTFAADDGSNAWLSHVARRYVETFPERKKEGKGLLLYGPVGTGKTFMSACIANALIDQGEKCLVTNFSRLVSDLEDVKFEGRQKYLDRLNENALIVIDDLGAERNTEYMAEKVFDIVDARCRSGKPLIITTNLTARELTNASDVRKQRIYSRLLEMCYPVRVDGDDRRRAKAHNDHRDLKAKLEPAEAGAKEGR